MTENAAPPTDRLPTDRSPTDRSPGAPRCIDEAALALPFYEPGHAAYARRIAAWCQAQAELWERADRGADRGDPDAAARDILRRLGEDGWLAFLDPSPGATDPERGGDLRALCLAREALAYSHDLADHTFSIQALAATPILLHGSKAQRQRYLPDMARGRLAGSFAISEEQAGSDVAGVQLTAARRGGGYVLDGEKAWIAGGSTADVHCVVARTGEGPGPLGLTAFLVPAATEGVQVRDRISFIAPRPFAHLAFRDCRVPAEAVLGQPGGGFAIAMQLLERFRVTVGAAALGFARRAAHAALVRARSRRIYGGRLFDLQLVKARLADAEVKLSAGALLVARAAWEADRGNRRFAKHSSIAKLYVTEAAQEIVDSAVQLFGAAGLVEGSVTERLYRQIRALRIYEGASEVQSMIIAGALDWPRGGPERPR